jgi:hypothetical protein
MAALRRRAPRLVTWIFFILLFFLFVDDGRPGFRFFSPIRIGLYPLQQENPRDLTEGRESNRLREDFFLFSSSVLF